MSELQDFLDKLATDKLQSINTSSINWEDGVDYFFELDNLIPCTYKDNGKIINAYCERINVFHPAGEDDSKFFIFYNLKKDKDKIIEDSDEYIIAKSKGKATDEHKKIITFGELNLVGILEIELMLYKETYKRYIEDYKQEDIKYVYDEVKKLEKEYQSEEDRTYDDIKACFYDDYILSIWEYEKYNEETEDGWFKFTDFLINFIKQNIMFE